MILVDFLSLVNTSSIFYAAYSNRFIAVYWSLSQSSEVLNGIICDNKLDMFSYLVKLRHLNHLNQGQTYMSVWIQWS